MSILIFHDYTLIFDNGVMIETVFERFDLPKLDNTYCCDFNQPDNKSSLLSNYLHNKGKVN